MYNSMVICSQWQEFYWGQKCLCLEGKESGLGSRHAKSKKIWDIHTFFIYTALAMPFSGH